MKLVGVALCVMSVACSGPPQPAALVRGQDACAECRMVIVRLQTAAQIVASGEEPRFFDEIGCLRNYLVHTPVTSHAAIFVADHRSREWVPASRAIFTRTSSATPMASGLIAHASPASREADPAAKGGTEIAAADILGASNKEAAP